MMKKFGLIFSFSLLFFISCKDKNIESSFKSKPETSVQSSTKTSKKILKIKYKKQKVNDFEDVLFQYKHSLFRDSLLSVSDSLLYDIIPKLEITPNRIPINILVENAIDNKEFGRFITFDISCDGNDDIIFNGFLGAEESGIIIWIYNNGEYYFSSRSWGRVKRIVRNNEKEKYSLITESGFCCGSFIGELNLLEPKITDHKITFELKNKYKLYFELKLPDSTMAPINFEVINNKYRLRYEPTINNDLDTTMTAGAGQDFIGNILAEFEPGSKGVALAKKNDPERVWWFVIMNPESNTNYNQFYADEGAFKMGWMSSKYLNVISR